MAQQKTLQNVVPIVLVLATALMVSACSNDPEGSFGFDSQADNEVHPPEVSDAERILSGDSSAQPASR